GVKRCLADSDITSRQHNICKTIERPLPRDRVVQSRVLCPSCHFDRICVNSTCVVDLTMEGVHMSFQHQAIRKGRAIRFILEVGGPLFACEIPPCHLCSTALP